MKRAQRALTQGIDAFAPQEHVGEQVSVQIQEFSQFRGEFPVAILRRRSGGVREERHSGSKQDVHAGWVSS